MGLNSCYEEHISESDQSNCSDLQIRIGFRKTLKLFDIVGLMFSKNEKFLRFFFSRFLSDYRSTKNSRNSSYQ